MWSCVIPAADTPSVHGLSGLYYDRTSSILWAASDDQDSYPAEPARLLRFRLGPAPSLVFAGSVTLARHVAEDATRAPPPLWQLEAVAPMIEKGAWNHFLFVSTERDTLTPGILSQIYRCTETGLCEPAVTLPRELSSSDGAHHGIQQNQGIEGLTTSPDGQRLFAAVERPLGQELPLPGERPRVRLLEYALDAPQRPLRQYAYTVDAAPAGGTDSPGVSEILALSTNRLLVLERGYWPVCGNTIRLFEVTLDPSRALPAGQSVLQAQPLEKQLLIDFTDEKGAFDEPKLSATLDNFEGMTSGPDLPDGSRTLLLVSDDNRRREQVTALVSVNLSLLPTAAARHWHDGDRPVCPVAVSHAR